jgi:hypothetical protein
LKFCPNVARCYRHDGTGKKEDKHLKRYLTHEDHAAEVTPVVLVQEGVNTSAENKLCASDI